MPSPEVLPCGQALQREVVKLSACELKVLAGHFWHA